MLTSLDVTLHSVSKGKFLTFEALYIIAMAFVDHITRFYIISFSLTEFLT